MPTNECVLLSVGYLIENFRSFSNDIYFNWKLIVHYKSLNCSYFVFSALNIAYK